MIIVQIMKEHVKDILITEVSYKDSLSLVSLQIYAVLSVHLQATHSYQ